jgi:hypothetical protein
MGFWGGRIMVGSISNAFETNLDIIELQAPMVKAPNYNIQINSKTQYSMTQTFEISNFGHCELFVICDLGCVIFDITPIPK